MAPSDPPRRASGLAPHLPFLATEGLTPLRPEPPTPATGLTPLGPVDGLRPLAAERIVPPGVEPVPGTGTAPVAVARRRATELDWDEPAPRQSSASPQ